MLVGDSLEKEDDDETHIVVHPKGQELAPRRTLSSAL